MFVRVLGEADPKGGLNGITHARILLGDVFPGGKSREGTGRLGEPWGRDASLAPVKREGELGGRV